jgi:hypothetical protein
MEVMLSLFAGTLERGVLSTTAMVAHLLALASLTRRRRCGAASIAKAFENF